MQDRKNSQGDLTSAQTKAELNCGDTKLWGLLNEKELDGYYMGNQIRITRPSVDSYKERHRYTPRADLKGSSGGETFSRRARKAAA